MDVRIKPMETEDEIVGKAYVHYQSWQETYAGLMDANYLANLTLEKCEKMARRFPDNVLVAKDGDRVVGFAGYGSYRDGSLPDCGEVYAIYVLREYHGQGVGYALMQAAMAKLAAHSRIAVWVLRGNERAIRFYERVGFRFDGAEMPVQMGTENVELRMIWEKAPAFDTEKMDSILHDLHIQPVGNGYIDLICPKENIAEFIDAMDGLNVRIYGFTWWCLAGNGHEPCGLGGPANQYGEGFFSEIFALGEFYEFNSNEEVRHFLLEEYPHSPDYRPCFHPGFWLEDPNCDE